MLSTLSFSANMRNCTTLLYKSVQIESSLQYKQNVDINTVKDITPSVPDPDAENQL